MATPLGGNQHPTVPFGQGEQDPGNPYRQQPVASPQNGFPFSQQQQPQAAPQPLQQNQYQQQPTPVAPQQQHPTAPFGQQQQAAPQQQPAPQTGRTMQITDDTVLDGPNIPAELRGRSFGQFRSIYGALANNWLQNQNQQQAPRQQTAEPQQPPQAAAATGGSHQGLMVSGTGVIRQLL